MIEFQVKKKFNLQEHTDELFHAEFCPNSKFLLTASADKTAKVWNIENGDLLFTLVGHSDTVYHATYSKDGGRIYTASKDKTVKEWCAHSGALLNTYSHESKVVRVIPSPMGSRLVTVCKDRNTRL